EAGAVDGATGWRGFVRITLPLLAPYVTMALLLRSIEVLRIFELALVLAGGAEPVLGAHIWSRYGPPTRHPSTAAAGAAPLSALASRLSSSCRAAGSRPRPRRPGEAAPVRRLGRRLRAAGRLPAVSPGHGLGGPRARHLRRAAAALGLGPDTPVLAPRHRARRP